MNDVRILIADDHPLTVSGLSLAVAAEGWTVCRTVHDGEAVESAVAATRPDVLLLDLGMPGRSGLAVLEALQAAPARPRIVVLSGETRPYDFARAQRAGADALVTKSESGTVLVEAIRRVCRGEFWTSPAARGLLGTGAAEAAALTPREHDVLRLLADGLSSKRIAQALGIAPATVRKHRENLLRKLGVSTAMAASREARRLGLLPP